MRPVRLELAGFLSYAEPTTLELEGVEAIAVVGDNGAGKTALLEAILWALYGRTRARSADEVVNDGSTVARVVFTFDLGGERFRVIRERHAGKSGKSELRLDRRDPLPDDWHVSHTFTPDGSEEPVDRDSVGLWRPVGGDKIADTQRAIEELLGMSSDLFESTAFVGQGDADRFTELRPAARKELLFELLELGHYAERAAAAHDEVTIHTSAIDKLEARIATISEELDAVGDPDELRARLDSTRLELDRLEEERAANLEVRDKALESLTEARSAIAGAGAARETADRLRSERIRRAEEIMRAVVTLEQRIRGLEEQARRADAAVEESTAQALRFAEVDARVTETTKSSQEAGERAERALREHEETRLALTRHTERLRILEEADAAFREGVCPTCRRPVTEAEVEGHDRLLASARAMVETAAANRNDAHETLERIRLEGVRVKDELDAARTELDGIRQAIADRDVALAQREAVEREFGQARTDLVHRRGELAAAQKPSAEEERLDLEGASSVAIRAKLDELEAAVADVTRLLERLETSISDHAAGVARISHDLERADRLAGDRDVALGEHLELGRQRARYAVLEEAFGRNGIPAEILRRSTRDLDVEANEILGALTAGRYSLAIETERALKGGRIAETLDVIVSDDRADRPLEALSGGERQAVDVALRLGLSRILATRSGQRIELLVLDETFAAFDAGRRQAAVELLSAVRDRFGAVVFVTHDRALAEAFPRRLIVERVGESSTARLE